MLLYVVLALLSFSFGQGQDTICSGEKSCTDCINAGSFCGWCLDPNYQDLRCADARQLSSMGCDEISIQQEHDIRSIRNLPFSNRRIARPQVLETKIRKGQTESYTVSARVPNVVDNPSSISIRVAVSATSPLTVTINAECNSAPQVRTNRLMCRSVDPGSVINFTLSVTLTECFVDPWELVVYTRIGRSKGLTKINIQSICECECEEDRYAPGPDDEYCSQNGRLICGQCECNPERYGRTCECEGVAYLLGSSPCAASNTTSICSGRGDCVCGVCDCHTILRNSANHFTGKYCDCNDFSCPYSQGHLCGGIEQGSCRCGQCMCTPGFTGEDCACPVSLETCLSRNGEICNGKGSCDCGRCTCNLDRSFMGIHCEDCPTCPGQCHLHRDCVECMAFGIGRISQDECVQRCAHSLIFMVDEITSDDNETGSTCAFRDPNNCMYYFRYEHNSPLVAVQIELECPGI